MYAEIYIQNQVYWQNKKFDFINAEVSKLGIYYQCLAKVVAYYYNTCFFIILQKKETSYV